MDIFIDLLNCFLVLLLSQENLTGYKLQDEKATRTSSVLHALSCISQSSLVCRRRALFAVLHLTRENTFDINIVKKVCLSDSFISFVLERCEVDRFDIEWCILRYWGCRPPKT